MVTTHPPPSSWWISFLHLVFYCIYVVTYTLSTKENLGNKKYNHCWTSEMMWFIKIPFACTFFSFPGTLHCLRVRSSFWGAGAVTTDKWDRILWPCDSLGSHLMAKNHLSYCYSSVDGNFPQFTPILFTSSTWKTRKKNVITGSSFLLFFSASVLTPPTSIWRSFLKNSSRDLESNHTVVRIWSCHH